jgi:hypothetical protein
MLTAPQLYSKTNIKENNQAQMERAERARRLLSDEQLA